MKIVLPLFLLVALAIGYAKGKCSKVHKNQYITGPVLAGPVKKGTQAECIQLCKDTKSCTVWRYVTKQSKKAGQRAKMCTVMRKQKTKRNRKGINWGQRQSSCNQGEPIIPAVGPEKCSKSKIDKGIDSGSRCEERCSKVYKDVQAKGPIINTVVRDTEKECIEHCQAEPKCMVWKYVTTQHKEGKHHHKCTIMKRTSIRSLKKTGINSGTRDVC